MTDSTKGYKRKKAATMIAELFVKWNKNKERIEKLQKQNKKLDREIDSIYYKWGLRS